MSFLNKNLGDKPSLVKPIAILAAVLLVIGGAYVFLGHKAVDAEKTEDAVKAEGEKVKVVSSGLDKDMKVKTVEDVEKVLEKWIDANPQAILASVANLQKKMMADQQQNAQKNIGSKKSELFEDKNSPQVAPSGYNVTIVEFFDYSCGYCKKAQATVEELLKEDKKVRVVFKEFPILGAASEEMSSVAIAVHMAEPSSYVKFHNALMKSNAHSKDEALQIAKDVGVNVAKLEATLKNGKDKISAALQANRTLGSSIGINGTPGFVIGEELVPGALDLASLKEKIAAVRKK